MPLTDYQASLARLLSENRTFDSYLAGGAAILIEPNTTRFSRDLDYFHDSEVRVAEAFADRLPLPQRLGARFRRPSRGDRRHTPLRPARRRRAAHHGLMKRAESSAWDYVLCPLLPARAG